MKLPSLIKPMSDQGSELAQAFGRLRHVVITIAIFSGIINLLALTGSLFMMQVYDRVLASRSLPTLIALAIITVILYVFQGALDFVRSRIMVRVAARLDQTFGERLYRCVLILPLRMRSNGDGMQPIRDLDTLRSFLSGPGPLALLDLPWMPIFLIFVFLLHPWLGLLSLVGIITLLGLTLLTERLSKAPARESQKESALRSSLALGCVRNAEVMRAMGLTNRMVERWLNANNRHLQAQERTSDVVGGIGAVSKVVRFVLQSAMLGMAAYLTIRGEVSPGAIIASSITSSRALAPIEAVIANWKGFLAARQSKQRLEDVLKAMPEQEAPMALPVPRNTLSLEAVTVCAPGGQTPLIHNVSLKLTAGQGVGIIGPSAAGKSTLVRAMVGVWPVVRGHVRIDGAAIDQWDADALGKHIGYLPQDVELFDGTVAENISRFELEPSPEAIVAAAQAADVHQMILHLPDGYETKVGDGGSALSAGQRQRIGLARALYGDPFLVVLDEPNSNLDAEGEAALSKAIENVRARGGIVVVVAHRPSALNAVDLVAVMANGALQAFGPKEEVLQKTTQPAKPPVASSGKIAKGMQTQARFVKGVSA